MWWEDVIIANFTLFCVQHKCFAIGKEYLVHISWKYCKISKQIFQFPAFNCFVLLPTQNLLDSKESTPKNSRKENIVMRYNGLIRNITWTYNSASIHVIENIKSKCHQAIFQICVSFIMSATEIRKSHFNYKIATWYYALHWSMCI